MRNRLGSAAGHRMPPAELCIGFHAQDDDEPMVEWPLAPAFEHSYLGSCVESVVSVLVVSKRLRICHYCCSYYYYHSCCCCCCCYCRCHCYCYATRCPKPGYFRSFGSQCHTGSRNELSGIAVRCFTVSLRQPFKMKAQSSKPMIRQLYFLVFGCKLKGAPSSCLGRL